MSQDGNKNKSDDDKNSVGAANNGGKTNKKNAATTTNKVSKVQNRPKNPVKNDQSKKSTTNRDHMIQKAVEFLSSPLIKDNPVQSKINFLRTKGLTDTEIYSSLAITNQNLHDDYPYPPPPNIPPYTVQSPLEEQPWYMRQFRTMAMASTVAYIAYQIYQKYIKNWLFGVRKSPIEIRLEGVESSMHRCLVLLEEKNNSPELSLENVNQKVELDQIRAELKTIKSLLLNKSQFPPAPMASSIPSWQLLKSGKQNAAEQQNKVNDSVTPLTVPQKPNQINGNSLENSSNSLQQSEFNGGEIIDLAIDPHTSVKNNDNIPPTSNESAVDMTSSMISDESVAIKNKNKKKK